MILTDAFWSEPGLTVDYAVQMGIRHGVIGAPQDKDFSLTDPSHWQSLYDKFTARGITPVVIEGMPQEVHEHIKRGDGERDAAIDRVIRLLPILDKLNIRVICTNWMPYIGWFRSRSDVPARGGALVTGFYQEDVPDEEPLLITQEQLWANLEYFLKAVVPHAEKYGVRIALHPDDPPVPRLKNVERILIKGKNMDRALGLVPSDMVGLTLCQGCFGAMGEDIYEMIRRYGGMGKIFFVHFRDVAGSPNAFCETFHDAGPTDMVKALELYRETGYQGPIRVDHVPTMAGEANDRPGYAAVGRLYAVGYLKGILDALRYPYI
jgi:mannonate dehydratase